ncbi:unnamed protein product, partial [Sphacelaria rigidula]
MPVPILMCTFGFTAHPYLHVLRGVCRGFREVLDDRSNMVWKSIMTRHCNLVVPRLLWGKSFGTTALMVRASKVQHTCVSCRLWFNLETNRFYDVLVCKRCSKKNVFKVVNLNRACFNFFLDYKVQKNNSLLVKEQKGRSFLVLLSHVRQVALEQHPNGELEKKTSARFSRAFRAELRKHEQRGRRIQDIYFKFVDILWQTPARVDSVLRDQVVLRDMVENLGSREDVFGDTLEKRVKAFTKTNVVAQRLYDYAAMLTYMRKLGLLDFRYDATPGHKCKPYYVFKHHLHDGLHFYELTRQHADGKNELSRRITDLNNYMLHKGNTLTISARKALAVAMCAEEAINYNPDDFEDFVLRQEGNPVEIARRVREKEFLNQNHLAWQTHHLVTTSGMDNEMAERMATKSVFHRTKGFPPMMRVCFIHLS